MDLNNLTPQEIVQLGYYLAEDMEKEAGADFDLNELSVDEFIAFAADLEEEMEKEAGVKEVMEMLKNKGKVTGSYLMDVAKGGRARRNIHHLRKGTVPTDEMVYGQHLKSRMPRSKEEASAARKAQMLGAARGIAETGTMYGAPVAGAAALYNRRKKRR